MAKARTGKPSPNVGGAWAAVDRGLQPMTLSEGGFMIGTIFVLLALVAGLLLLALDLAGGG